MAKVIFSFDDKSAKKLKNKKNILGGKGANLGEMGRLGLPVPPGFTITTEVCDLFYKNKKKLPKKVIQNIESELKNIEKKTRKKFGDLKNPLLVSVRSGARISMPGMMDTILNLGLNDKTVESLKNKTFNKIRANKPNIIIFKTIKGKGIKFMENNNDWHHGRLTKNLYLTAINDLKKNYA